MLYVNPIDAFTFGPTAGLAEKTRSEKAAVQELEHLFLFTLLKEMRKTTDAGVKKKHEVQLYEEMLDDALSGAMSKSSQIGLAEQLEQQLNKEEGECPSELGPTSNLPANGKEKVVSGAAFIGLSPSVPPHAEGRLKGGPFIPLGKVKQLKAYADNNMDNEIRPLEKADFAAIGSNK